MADSVPTSLPEWFSIPEICRCPVAPDKLPIFMLVLNVVAIVTSIIAIFYWLKLYNHLYKKDERETRGWVWLFACSISIAVFNISSLFVLFNLSTNLLGLNRISLSVEHIQLLNVVGRTVIGLLMTVGIYFLYAPMKHAGKYVLTAIVPTAEEESLEEMTWKLLPGRGYLILGKKREKAYDVFVDQVTHGFEGLCITRDNPAIVRETFGLKKTMILWLTDIKSPETLPPQLEEISIAIHEFIGKSEKSVVLLDGLDYLITTNSFNLVLQMVNRLKDLTAVHSSILLIPIDSSTMDNKQFGLLQREMESISDKE
ncbi:MAG: DUF835 domain-containing protein [Candidatus Altiarchaeota archaeon]